METTVLGLALDSSVIIAAERRRAFIDELTRYVTVHPITEETARIAGKIEGEQAAKGVNIPFEDVLIGASAIEQGYAVGTSNLRHFRLIPGLNVKQV